MKYLYNNGIGKQGSRKWLVVSSLLLVIGLYLGFNTLSPIIFSAIEPSDRTTNLLKTQQPQPDVDRLYIPKINANVTIAPIGTDETTAFDMGAVSRPKQNGNPKAGGNYVLVAKRFSLQLSPYDTYKKSPFYSLESLRVGDDLFVDYKGTRYAYKIDTHELKESADPSSEDSSEDAKLTLYTSEMTSDGRSDIITAQQVGQVIWTAGTPSVQPVRD